MTPKEPTTIPHVAFVFASAAIIVVAFLRGNYLLGFGCGLAYVFLTAALIWLFARSFRRKGKASLIQMISVFILAVPVGFAMAFPAAINSRVQYFIDDQATDRTARAELKHIFKSDASFARLSISTTHLKVVNVTIYGSLPTRNDLERLQTRISTECPTLKLCPLHWDIELSDSNERIDGLDRELFPSAAGYLRASSPKRTRRQLAKLLFENVLYRNVTKWNRLVRVCEASVNHPLNGAGRVDSLLIVSVQRQVPVRGRATIQAPDLSLCSSSLWREATTGGGGAKSGRFSK